MRIVSLATFTCVSISIEALSLCPELAIAYLEISHAQSIHLVTSISESI